MVYVFAFYFLFHNNLPFCSRIHHYSFPLKSSIFLKFDLYFLHFCNFDLQLQLHLHILLIHYALNSISALVAILPRSHTNTLVRADHTHTLSHSHKLASVPKLPRSLPPLHITHQLLLLPWHRAGGHHFFALNTLLLLCFRFFFFISLDKCPAFESFDDKVLLWRQWLVRVGATVLRSALIQVTVQPQAELSVSGTDRQTLRVSLDEVEVLPAPVEHFEVGVELVQQRLARTVKMIRHVQRAGCEGTKHIVVRIFNDYQDGTF